MLWGRHRRGREKGQTRGAGEGRHQGRLVGQERTQDRDKLLPGSLAQGLRSTYPVPTPSPGLGFLVLPCRTEAQGRKGIGPGSPAKGHSSLSGFPPRFPTGSGSAADTLHGLGASCPQCGRGGPKSCPRDLLLSGSLLWPAHLSGHSPCDHKRLCLPERNSDVIPKSLCVPQLSPLRPTPL